MLGQFRTYPKSAFDAGWDSMMSGPDMVNCYFGWFTSPESAREWQRGRDAAKSKSRTNESTDAESSLNKQTRRAAEKAVQAEDDRLGVPRRANTKPKSELAPLNPLNKRKNNE